MPYNNLCKLKKKVFKSQHVLFYCSPKKVKNINKNAHAGFIIINSKKVSTVGHIKTL